MSPETLPSAADLDAISAESATAEATAAPAAQTGEANPIEPIDQQTHEVKFEFPLGDVIHEVVKEELKNLLAAIQVEPPADAFSALEARVAILEKDLESKGLLTRAVTVEPSEV